MHAAMQQNVVQLTKTRVAALFISVKI